METNTDQTKHSPTYRYVPTPEIHSYMDYEGFGEHTRAYDEQYGGTVEEDWIIAHTPDTEEGRRMLNRFVRICFLEKEASDNE